MTPEIPNRAVEGASTNPGVIKGFLNLGGGIRTRRTFKQFMKALWFAIRGHTKEDLLRLKEAGVSIAEGKSRGIHADASLTEAKAEETQSKVAVNQSQSSLLDAQAYAVRRKADSEYMESMVSAYVKMSDPMIQMKKAGFKVPDDIRDFAFMWSRRQLNSATDKEIQDSDSVPPPDG